MHVCENSPSDTSFHCPGVGLSAQARALSGSSSSLNRKMSGSVQSLNSDSISMHGSSHDLAMRHLFDQVNIT